MIDKNKEVTKENDATLAEEITSVLEEVVQTNTKENEKPKGVEVKALDNTNFLVGERQYVLVKNHREAFDLKSLGERFSDVLSRYDYIVGDWGYDQLRLKGFFYTENRTASPDQRIDSLEDYLYEYCNFGCAYFVIEQVGGKREKNNLPKKKRSKNYPSNKKQTNATPKYSGSSEKKNKTMTPNNNVKNDSNTTKKTKKKKGTSKNFTIRQREE